MEEYQFALDDITYFAKCKDVNSWIWLPRGEKLGKAGVETEPVNLKQKYSCWPVLAIGSTGFFPAKKPAELGPSRIPVNVLLL